MCELCELSEFAHLQPLPSSLHSTELNHGVVTCGVLWRRGECYYGYHKLKKRWNNQLPDVLKLEHKKVISG